MSLVYWEPLPSYSQGTSNFLQILECLFCRVGNTLVKKGILRRVTGTDPSREARELSPG